MPDGAIVGTVVAADGVRLRFARWRASGRRTLGTVCILPGRGESIEKYFETIARPAQARLRGRDLRLARAGRLRAAAAQSA